MNERPRTRFEWPVYADATLAGLSVLVPVPFVDDAFETYVRRQAPVLPDRQEGHGPAEPLAAQYDEVYLRLQRERTTPGGGPGRSG